MKNRKNPKLLIKKLKNGKTDRIFLDSLRKNLVAYIELNPLTESKKGSLLSFVLKKAIVIPVAIIILSLGITNVFASSNKSIPGDTLYPVKIFTENIRIALTASPQQKADLNLQFANNRLEEIKELATNVQEAPTSTKINISSALNNLKFQINGASIQISTLKNSGNTTDSSQLNEKLSKEIDFYSKELGSVGEEHDELNEVIEESVSNLNSLKSDSNNIATSSTIININVPSKNTSYINTSYIKKNHGLESPAILNRETKQMKNSGTVPPNSLGKIDSNSSSSATFIFKDSSNNSSSSEKVTESKNEGGSSSSSQQVITGYRNESYSGQNTTSTKPESKIYEHNDHSEHSSSTSGTSTYSGEKKIDD